MGRHRIELICGIYELNQKYLQKRLVGQDKTTKYTALQYPLSAPPRPASFVTSPVCHNYEAMLLGSLPPPS